MLYFVIRKFNSGEADLILHLLDEQGIKVPCVAKGAKKPTSRKAHAIELLNLIDLKFSESNKGLPIIAELKLKQEPTLFKSSLVGIMWLQLIAEIIGFFAQEGQEQPALYRNLENLLNVKSDKSLPLLAAGFLLRLMYINGDIPNLNRDLESDSKLTAAENIYANPEQPGYVLKQPYPGLEPIPNRLLKTQLFMLQYDFQQLQKIDLSLPEQIQLLQLHHDWFRHTIGKELITIKSFIQAVNKHGIQ